MRPVVVEARRVDGADAAQQPQARVARFARLRGSLCGRAGGRLAYESAGAGIEDGRSEHAVGLARRLHERGRRALAEAEAGAALPCFGVGPGLARARGSQRALELGAEHFGARAAADDVVADVGDPRRPRLRREQRVGVGHAERLGGRHLEALAHVAEGALADPAGGALDRPERGQQQLATPASGVAPALGDAQLGAAADAGARASGRAERRIEGRVDGGHLGGARRVLHAVQVH